MKIVGLTGGIGSGKTTVAAMFTELGVPVYNSDEQAKQLMVASPELREQITALLGKKAYRGGELQRKYIAEKVFKDPELLNALNGLVHPAVKLDFMEWAAGQEFSYVIQEAAILFENGAYPIFDKMILVTAPEEVRITRIRERDGVSREAILERMQHQWGDARKMELADYLIVNTNLEETRKQVAQIHTELLEL